MALTKHVTLHVYQSKNQKEHKTLKQGRTFYKKLFYFAVTYVFF